jgi:hypothetical protein
MDNPTKFIDGVDLTKLYQEHNPSRDPFDVCLREGMLMTIRYPKPGEETRGGIIIPAKEEDSYQYMPNCSRIVAVGPNLTRKDIVPGRYAFWVFAASADDAPRLKPQPLVYQYGDSKAVLWVIHEDSVLLTVPHAGDPDWLEFGDNDLMVPKMPDALDRGERYLQVQSVTGDWRLRTPDEVKAGEIFRLSSEGKVYRAVGSAVGHTTRDERDDEVTRGPWKVFCAPTTMK